MIPSSTITTRRGKRDPKNPKKEKTTKMADGDDNLPETDMIDQEITLRDLYKLTLSVKKGLTSEIDSQKKRTESLEDENEKLQDEVKEQGKLIQLLTTRVEMCESMSKFNQIQIEENRDDIDRTDDKSRRHNLVIYGIPEEDGKSPRENVKELFVELGLPFGINHTDAVYRIGPARKSKRKFQRPILCELIRKSDKGEIFKRVATLKGKPNWKSVSIGDDLSPKQNRNRQDLRDICALAKKQKIDARLSGNALVIDGRRYLHKDIPNLPHDLKLADAKLVKCKGGIAFQGPATYLSNLHKVSFKFEDLDFTSVEQALVYMKALICGAATILSCIRSIDDPFRIKSLSRKIVATKEWNEQRDEVLYEIVKAKFVQNLKYAKALIATGDLDIFEATRDSHFGCGFPLSQAFQIDRNCPGKNVGGDILMQVREELKQEDGAEIVHLSGQESDSSEGDQDTQ